MTLKIKVWVVQYDNPRYDPDAVPQSLPTGLSHLYRVTKVMNATLPLVGDRLTDRQLNLLIADDTEVVITE